MTNQDPELPKKSNSLDLQRDHFDSNRSEDPDDIFRGLDDSIADAEESWQKKSGTKKSSVDSDALKAFFGEPMRAADADRPETSRSVNVRDVLGPGGNDQIAGPHKHHFSDFAILSNNQQLVMPGTADAVLRLGRNPLASDLTFGDGAVSREHATITRDDKHVYISNKQESNVTKIVRDGVEIVVSQHPGKTELLPGDIIKLGPSTEIGWLRATDAQNLGKPNLYRPEVANGDPAASELARRESNAYLRNHEYAKPFPNGFQNIGGDNLIDRFGMHNDSERPSVVLDRRPGADPALERFLADMHQKYDHLKNDPKALAEALAKEAKLALEPRNWSNSAVDNGYDKLRSENAGKRMLLGDFLEAAKYQKGAGVCNHQAMLLKAAFDTFYPETMTNRPEMKMVRGFYGESPEGKPREVALNHAWTTLTVPKQDGSKGSELIYDPRQQIYGDSKIARPNHHPGKDVPVLMPKEQHPAAIDLQLKPLTASEIELIKGREVSYSNRGWRLKGITGEQAEITATGYKTADAADILKWNPTAAENGKLVIGQEYNMRRSTGEIEPGWTLVGVTERDGKNEYSFAKAESLQRRVPLAELQRQNRSLFDEIARDRAAKEKPAPQGDVLPVAPLNAEQRGFSSGREVLHNGQVWVVQGQDGKNIEIARGAQKEVSPAVFERLNGTVPPEIGKHYLVKRSSGEIESWKLTNVDAASGELTLHNPTGFREKVSLERLAEQNRDALAPLDVQRVLGDPRTKIDLICRWTDGNSPHDKWLGTAEGPNGERVRVMVHKPPYGNDWVRLRNDLAAQELAKVMDSPQLFPATVTRDGLMVQAFVGEEGENGANFLHDRSRQDPILRAQNPDLAKRIDKLLTMDPVLRHRVAEGVAFSVLLGDIDQHGLNFVINRTGNKPNDFHLARIDTDYAFSTSKKLSMDQMPNYGSVMNGAFSNLSGSDLPPEVHAKMKNVAEKLSTATGRAEFAAATKLSGEQVEALAERARTLAETGKFPRSRTFEELRGDPESVMASRDGGTARTAGEAIEVHKVGTVVASDSGSLVDYVKQLRDQRPALEAKLRATSGPEKGIYTDMVKLLDELKATGKVGKDWELFPTETHSPADKIGCDVLFLNTKTGEIQKLDFTKDPAKLSDNPDERRKQNVTEIRKDGVILFDKDSRDNPQFTRDLANQLTALSKKTSLLKVGDCPFPSLEVKNPATTKVEIDRFVKWSADKAAAPGTTAQDARLYKNQADIVNRASISEQKTQAEVKSPVLESKVRDLARREIVDLALASLTKSEAPIPTGTAKSEVKAHSDRIKLTLSPSEIHITGDMTSILAACRRDVLDDKIVKELIASKKGIIAKVLTPNELSRLGISAQQLADIDSPKTSDRALREKALKEVSKKIANEIVSQKDLIEVDGKGKGARTGTVTERVLARLASKEADNILDRIPKTEPRPAPAPPVVEKPYESAMAFAKADLGRTYVDIVGNVKVGSTADPAVIDTMDLMLEEKVAKKEWTEQQAIDFKKLRDSYTKGDAETVAIVNKHLTDAVQSVTGGTVRSAVPSEVSGQTLEQQKETFQDLRAAKDVSKMKDFALTTTDHDLAKRAIAAIVDAQPENLIEILQEVSSSKSRATGAAIHALYTESDSPKDEETFRKLVQSRWNNGEFFELMKSEIMKPADLVKALDEGGIEFGEKAISELFAKVGDSPKLKEQVAMGILKIDMIGGKDLGFESTSVSKTTRLEAIEYLGKQSSPESAKALESVMRSREQVAATAARNILAERWTSDKQRTSGESINELIVGDRLKKYIEEVSKVNWPDGRDVNDLRKRHRQAAADVYDASAKLARTIAGNDADKELEYEARFGDKQYMERLLKDRPNELAQYHKFLETKDAATLLATEYTTITTERMKMVDTLVKRYCAELGLPAAKLEFFEPGARADNRGEYYSGTGKILINDELARKGLSPDSEFMSTLFHELGHLEQDTLNVRRLADQLKIGNEATAEQLPKLMRLYKERYGREKLPDENFIKDVLKERKGVQLTDAQGARADKLIESFSQLKTEEELRKFAERMNRRILNLKGDAPLFIMLPGKDPLQSAQKMFETDQLPKQLTDAIEEWQAADKSKAPNRDALESTLRELLIRNCRRQGIRAQDQAHEIYSNRAHEVETFDISARSRLFGQEAARARANSTAGDATVGRVRDTSTTGDAIAGRSKTVPVEPAPKIAIDAERATKFLERVAPDASESLASIAERASEFYTQDADKKMEGALQRTKILEDAALKAGESKLVFTQAGKEFVPKSFDSVKGTFDTVDGAAVELKNCQIEIRIGKNTPAQQVAREAFAGFEQLRQELTLKAGANAEAMRAETRKTADSVFDQALAPKPSGVELGGEAVVKIGAFEVEGKNVEVLLTSKGVRIGGRDLSNLELVDSALKEKRAELAKAKAEDKPQLETALKELEDLRKDVDAGKSVEVERLHKALVEHVSKEYEAGRQAAAAAPGKGLKARAAEATGRAGAYLMIAAFVASMMASDVKAKDQSEPNYAPTKAR